MTEPWLPSTLPKRTAAKTVERLVWARAWISSSHSRLVAPMTLVGLTALSVETRMQWLQPSSSARRQTTQVPSTLFSTASRALSSMSGTCLWAAAWKTTLGRYRWKQSRTMRSLVTEPMTTESVTPSSVALGCISWSSS